MSVAVIAAELRSVAKFVRQVDLGEIQAPSGGNREARRHVEGIGRVQAGVERRCAEADRCYIARRLVDEETETLHRRKLIGIDRSQLACGGELYKSAVDAQSKREIVPVIEDSLR